MFTLREGVSVVIPSLSPGFNKCASRHGCNIFSSFALTSYLTAIIFLPNLAAYNAITMSDLRSPK